MARNILCVPEEDNPMSVSTLYYTDNTRLCDRNLFGDILQCFRVQTGHPMGCPKVFSEPDKGIQ